MQNIVVKFLLIPIVLKHSPVSMFHILIKPSFEPLINLPQGVCFKQVT
jgi:hypothetical protein